MLPILRQGTLGRPLGLTTNSLDERPALGAALVCLVVLCSPPQADAQTFELSPFLGYRVGGDFYEVAVGQPVDTDGAHSVGLLADLWLPQFSPGLTLTALFTRQQPLVEVRPSLFDPPVAARVTVDHLQVGATQELYGGPVRPFLVWLMGLTRYGLPHDSETRFSVSGGAGVKLFAAPWIGVRFDGRVFATFDALGARGVCGGYGCVLGIDAAVFWQGEATAGLVFAF